VKIVKYIGSASKNSRSGLSSKESSVFKGKTILFSRNPKRRYLLTIYKYDPNDWFNTDRTSRNIWSDNLDSIYKYIEKKKIEFYKIFDNVRRKEIKKV